MKKLLFTISLLLLSAHGLSAQEEGEEARRGEQVGWARLKTSGDEWRRHATGDPVLMRFLRTKTSLNIDPTWYVADVENLDEMCKYPLLFAQSIQPVGDERGRANLAEYIPQRWLLLIDACINQHINPDPDVFLAKNTALLGMILPESKVIPLSCNHPIYNDYFQIPDGRPPHTYFNNIFEERWHKHGLYAIMIGSRMAGLISLSGLQCGWDRMIAPPGHDVACMRMLVNIYIYAMMQGNEGSSLVNSGLSTPSAP